LRSFAFPLLLKNLSIILLLLRTCSTLLWEG
jgi:hypothetical protein